MNTLKTCLFIFSTLLFFSCGGSKDSSQSNIKYEITPKDTLTKPEDGGYGFEDVAESMGFETYVFTEDDYKYFGDSRAKKGGNLKFTGSRFPATMRVLGIFSLF